MAKQGQWGSDCPLGRIGGPGDRLARRRTQDWRQLFPPALWDVSTASTMLARAVSREGFIKREGRPTEKEVLTSRLIDRPIRLCSSKATCRDAGDRRGAIRRSAPRPLDPGHHWRGRNRLRSPIFRSNTCWEGIRVGSVDGKPVANPTLRRDEGFERSNIVVAGTEGGIVMVESGANQATEAEVLDAIEFGHACCKKIGAAIRELVKKVGKTKREFKSPELNKDLYPDFRRLVRADSDGRDGHREAREDRQLPPHRRVQEESHGADCRRAEGGSRQVLRRAEGTHLPRPDVEGPPPSGRPGNSRPRSAGRSDARSASCRVRMGRACSPAGKRRRWSRRRSGRKTMSSALNCSNSPGTRSASCCDLQLSALQRRRSRLHARRGPPRNRPRSIGGARIVEAVAPDDKAFPCTMAS